VKPPTNLSSPPSNDEVGQLALGAQGVMVFGSPRAINVLHFMASTDQLICNNLCWGHCRGSGGFEEIQTAWSNNY